MLDSTSNDESATFVMVDDDEEDIYLTKRAFGEYENRVHLSCVQSGAELFDYLAKKVAPKLILLDVNMPIQNGFEVIQMIKANKKYAHIPIVMFTTSDAEADIRRAYSLGASSYICKPANAPDMKMAAQRICDYWLGFSQTPSHVDR